MIRYSSNEDASRVLDWVGADRLLEILQSDRYRFYDAAGAGRPLGGQELRQGRRLPARPDPAPLPRRNGLPGRAASTTCSRATRSSARALNAMMKEALSNPGIRHKFVKGLESRPGVRDLPQVRHLEGLPCRQRAGRVRRLPLHHRRPRRAPARRRLAGATRGAAARSRRIPPQRPPRRS